MFDISFSEMLLCFVVALVVLGPERMPAVARAVGRWTGKAKGYVRNLTAELERETHIAEMKKQVEDAHRILKEQSNEVRSNVDANMKAIRGDLHSITGVIDAPQAENLDSLAEKPVSAGALPAAITAVPVPEPLETAAPTAVVKPEITRSPYRKIFMVPEPLGGAVGDGPDGTEQPLLSHLRELRTRVIRALFGVAIAFAPLAYFSRTIYHYFAAPLMRLMPAGSSMIATEVASPFIVPFKLAALLAFAVALPWVLYQIWAFVAPGLYKNERRLIFPLLASSTLLFYVGVAFAYFIVLPVVFRFFVNVAPEGVAVMTDVAKYLDFVLKLFLAFGLTFETPVAIVLLAWSGMVTPQQLAARRDYVLVGVFVAAAILTPPDILSQTLLAVPTYLLFEIGIFAARWVVRARDRSRAEADQAEAASASKGDPKNQ